MSEVCYTVSTNSNASGRNTPIVLVYESHNQDSRYRPLGEICETVSAKYGTGGGNQPIVLMYEEDGSKHGQWATAQHGDGRTGKSSGLYARCPSNPNQRERERDGR